MDEINLLTLKEVAEAKRCSYMTVWNAVNTGNLSATKVHRVWLVKPTDALDWKPRRYGKRQNGGNP